MPIINGPYPAPSSLPRLPDDRALPASFLAHPLDRWSSIRHLGKALADREDGKVGRLSALTAWGPLIVRVEKALRQRGYLAAGQRLTSAFVLNDLVEIVRELDAPDARSWSALQARDALNVPLSAVLNLLTDDKSKNSNGQQSGGLQIQLSQPRSPAEWAKMFGVSVRTVGRWKKDGKIHPEIVTTKSWRLPSDEVKKFSRCDD